MKHENSEFKERVKIMPKLLKGFLTVVVSSAMTATVFVIFALIVNARGAAGGMALAGAILGLLYGLEAGILLIYDLEKAEGWLMLILDLTWSLPNTLFGLVFGNAIYVFIGWPSRAQSEGQTWIVFMPRNPSGTGFGHTVLQTLGTINLGGAGNHEKIHLLQARIFGPLYLPVFGINYAINFLIQALWTVTLGMLLNRMRVRDVAYFRPPSSSAVGGFFGWIYYATLFELWAYGTERH